MRYGSISPIKPSTTPAGINICTGSRPGVEGVRPDPLIMVGNRERITAHDSSDSIKNDGVAIISTNRGEYGLCEVTARQERWIRPGELAATWM